MNTVAHLNESALEQIQQLENQLDIILIGYNK